MTPAISVQSLSKLYHIGAREKLHRSLRETIADAFAAPFRRRTASAGPEGNGERNPTIWALKDVTFDVPEGQVVGIIGRNGAGKSTLLKILSRITEPTSGEVRLRGRVASLLEVGTGFHQELSGRDNVYLNGAILGMSRAEIRRKFDEIVAFAEIEKFIDTPVKHYSSGMYVRLAFAVAAHLEPEILLVDEVLAVGDAEFQKKCLGKMDRFSRAGRTVVFVSHNMAAIQQLCGAGILLDRGRVVTSGGIQAVIGRYVADASVLAMNPLAERNDRDGTGWLKFTSVTVLDREGREMKRILSGDSAILRFSYASTRARESAKVDLAFNVFSAQGYVIAHLGTVETGATDLCIGSSGYFECEWPRFNLRSGSYLCNLFCAVDGEIVDWIQSAFVLHVDDGDFFRTGRLADRAAADVLVAHAWRGQVTS